MAWLYPRIQTREPLTVDELYDNLGFDKIIGVSIVGKNAIAGPVVAGAVVLPTGNSIKILHSADSLNPSDLQRLAHHIKMQSEFVFLGWGTVLEIHHQGLDTTIDNAVSSSLRAVSPYNTPDFIILDDFQFKYRPPNLMSSNIHLLTVKKAHAFVEPVIAAQIVAKAARDVMMGWLHKEFPEYDWENNNGYATPMHIEAIRMHGITSYHRPLDSVKSLKGEKLFWHEKLRSLMKEPECTQ